MTIYINNNNNNCSIEQNKIIEEIKNYDLIKVDAVAGSGKTTTIIELAKTYNNLNILQITYNSMLKNEVRQKVFNNKLRNLSIHTYHSLCVRYYDKNAWTDEELSKIVLLNKNINEQNPIKYDILVIDEAQDMTLEYFNLICKFIIDAKLSKIKMIVLGDKYQSIYDFKNANPKFLMLSDAIWYNFFNKQFNRKINTISINLSKSYRVSKSIAWFVNNILTGSNRIISAKDNVNEPQVSYYVSNSYNIYKKLGDFIITEIKLGNVKENDIFILVPSLKTLNASYKKLENYFVKHGYKCVVPVSDNSKLDDEIIKNKIVFTTFHQSKGRERKLVVVYNFDSSYSQFYNNTNKNVCPSTLYVAVTRATYKLILIQDNKHKPLEFINTEKLQNNTNIQYIITDKAHKENIKIQNVKKTSVTDLIKFLSPEIITKINDIIENNKMFTTIKESKELIKISNKILINDLYEDVSELNGLVIPSIYEKNITGQSSIETYINYNIKELNGINKYIGTIPKSTSISKFLKLGNIYLAMNNNLHSKVAQISKYDWLDNSIVNKCLDNMKDLGKNIVFEIGLGEDDSFLHYDDNIGNIEIRGRLDAIDITNKTMYEFKCVDSLNFEHKLQLIIYAWIYNNTKSMINKYNIEKYYLLNIKSGNVLSLNYKHFCVKNIINIIINSKYSHINNNINDDDFINLCY